MRSRLVCLCLVAVLMAATGCSAGSDVGANDAAASYKAQEEKASKLGGGPSTGPAGPSQEPQ